MNTKQSNLSLLIFSKKDLVSGGIYFRHQKFVTLYFMLVKTRQDN